MSILLADIDATCAALGYCEGQKYHADLDSLQGLKHLIWILRRDSESHEYRRHLGHSKVLQTDLVYMLPDYIDNDEFADVLIRLLVILTTPTLLLYRDGPPEDNHGRKVFLELIDILQGYKLAFTRLQIWNAVFGKLQQSLDIDRALRSEEQCLLIERILVLIRNVLQVPANPALECRADNDASVHDQVLWVLHQSGVLDLVLFVTSSPDEHQFHLHSLEILCLLFREQTAQSLADASLQRSTSDKQHDEQELIMARQREKKRQVMRPPPARHSRFGGTYVIRNLKSISDRDIICHQPLERAVALDFDREKQQQKRSHRLVKEEGEGSRRSTFSVRFCLREFCIEFLRSAYNILVRQVRRVLERNSGSMGHDDSYLLWAIRFFMEFNRLTGLQLHLVSESLSVQSFHWILMRMQHDMDMIVSDKKHSKLWAKRLHVAVQAFRELLQSLLGLQKLKDPKAKALFDMLLNNICYVLEYREVILHLLINYNEAHSTKAYLRDVIETVNIFLKMMEKFCKDSVVIQEKGRAKKHSGKKSTKMMKTAETEEQLSNRWAQMADEVTTCLKNELQLAEEDQPVPFDSTSEKSINDQKEDCMIRIHKFLRESMTEKAVSLMRAAREVWPENEVFGACIAAPEDELLLLREIFLHNISAVEDQEEDVANSEVVNSDADVVVNEEELDNSEMVEKTIKFEDFAKRLLNSKIARACIVVLNDWERIPTKSLKATVSILHHIAYGCSCPAMLYQATLFRIFQDVFNAPRDVHQEELRRLGVFVVRKFVDSAPCNPKIFAELLFHKSMREVKELECGYCDTYDSGTKGTWTEEQETELRLLFEENQCNPQSDMDVIDWILENLIDKTRTRRGVLKKLKELGLMFRAPTKKSSAGTATKKLWCQEEDEELRSMYDQYRTKKDCLDWILIKFSERKNKQQIIKRMLQLHIIADKSEILPQKQRKRQSKQQMDDKASRIDDMVESNSNTVLEKALDPFKCRKTLRQQLNKPQQRKIVRSPLDMGTVRTLMDELDTGKYHEAINWLKECLFDAGEDMDEPAEENDGVPLLPLLEIQKEAMEDLAFQKILLALGMQPPIVGTENYWRIPTYLNAADLRLRIKILSVEEFQDDVNYCKDEGDENDEAEDNSKELDSNQSGSESEEDFCDDYLKRQKNQIDDVENYMDRRRDNLNSLIYSKNDNDDKLRKSDKHKEGQCRNRQKDIKEGSGADSDNLIGKQSNKRRNFKKQYKSAEDKGFKKKDARNIKKMGMSDLIQISTSGISTDNIFDQLKAERAHTMTKILADAIVPTTSTNINEDDEFNFNSEDYRKRLMELGDSDEEENNGKQKYKTIDQRNNYEKNSCLLFNEMECNGDAKKENIIKNNVEKDFVGEANNQTIDRGTSSNAHGKKRRQFVIVHANDNSSDNGVFKNDVNYDDDDSLCFKRPSKDDQLQTTSEGRPAKRCRFAIIDEDDED